MQLKKNIYQKFYYVFIVSIIGMLLSACSDKSVTEQSVEKQVETKEEKSKEVALKEEETQDCTTEDLETTTIQKTMTLHDFINRWNEIDSDSLSEEIKTSSIEDGLIMETGSLGSSDYYIAALNQNNKNIKKISLSLTYHLVENDKQNRVGDNIIHDTSVLIDVLEPGLEDKDRDIILKSLGLSEGYVVPEGSVRMDRVTYSVIGDDDRFWLDATFDLY